MKGLGKCHKVPLQVQDLNLQIKCYSLPLKGLDTVLGVEWIMQLSTYTTKLQ